MIRIVILFTLLMLFPGCSSQPGNPPAPIPPPILPKPPENPLPKPPLSACNFAPKSAEEVRTTQAVEDTLVFPALIGGSVADPKDWPVSIWIGNCSATVIGERVVASAAHCMRNGATVNFSIGATRYSAKCAHHPEYRGNSTADWAICLTDKKVETGPYENINTNPKLVLKGDMVTLSGYGCQKWGGGIDGKFRTGESPVIGVPSGKNYDIVTRGKAALCSGDSGGAAYKSYPNGNRVLISLNSRSNTTDTSYIPSVAEATNLSFFREWASNANVKVCGLHLDALGCRDAKPEPPKPPEFDFEINAHVACIRGKMKVGKEPKQPTLIETIKKALDSFE